MLTSRQLGRGQGSLVVFARDTAFLPLLGRNVARWGRTNILSKLKRLKTVIYLFDMVSPHN